MTVILKRTVLLLVCTFLIAGCKEKSVSSAPEVVENIESTSTQATIELSSEYGEQLGSVEFPVSCKEAARPLMERGLALLHHMTYEGAEASFKQAIKADPECALAHWGVAMTYIHPMWHDPPSEQRLNLGLESLRVAAAIPGMTEREAAWIRATLAYYEGANSRREPDSLELFRLGWKSVYEAYPEDIEAAAFYALTTMATASLSDKSLSKQIQAGAIAESVLEKIPDHPAAHHYIIHAYDSSRFADQALKVAMNYSEVAPEVPHALHMPTHIFTRLGYWDESIDMNIRSARAAESEAKGEYVNAQMLHAEDYLVYAHLQKGREKEARDIMMASMQLEAPFGESAIGASAYALAAMPARIALESQKWEEGTQIVPRSPASFPWGDQFAEYEAISWFGMGISAARSNKGDMARDAIEHLNTLNELLKKEGDDYWATQVEIQALAVKAWLAWSEADTEQGLAIMRQSAELEESTDKHPITPGEILPANELFGDMLMETGHAEQALAAYRSSLLRSPNRFNSLYGAATAARTMGDMKTASVYFSRLLEITQGTDPGWARLDNARKFMASVHGQATSP